MHNKRRNAYVCILPLIAFVLFLLPNTTFLKAQVLDKTVAIVRLHKTENISKQKLTQQYKLLEQQTNKKLSNDDKKEVLDALINDVLIVQAANSGKYRSIAVTEQQIDKAIEVQKQSLGTPISDEDYKRWIKAQLGLSWNEYRNKLKSVLIQQQYITLKYNDEIKNLTTPTEKKITQFYDQYATNFTNPAMVRISHLYFDTRNSTESQQKIKQKAFELASKINSNVPLFDKYFQESVDDTSYVGEDLGYIIRDARSQEVLGESFLNKLFALNKNKVSGVIESRSGYHIVKITDKRSPRLLTLTDPILPGQNITVKDRIKDILQNMEREKKIIELVQQEVAELRKKAEIKYFLTNL